jgi:hypothetical protein
VTTGRTSACRSAIDGELEPTCLGPRLIAQPRKAFRVRAVHSHNGIDRAMPKAILILEDVMPTLVGFGRFSQRGHERTRKAAGEDAHSLVD